MATTISVNKQTIEQFLLNARTKPFVIPEYQRPYSWTSDQIDTLFNDIWEFTCNEGGTDKEGTYFLGSIVSYENDKGEQEIIDGQQRITSIFLLLRAIYTKLNGVEEKTEEAKNFISKIEPLIWSTNKLTGKVDYSSILLNSKVINETENEILKNIKEAIEKIESKFYKIISANGKERIRERVFCYELYHQLRLIEFDHKFDIHGELDKAGFYDIDVIPDFLFHKQGSDENYCVIEVKGKIDSKGIRKDFKTLRKFLVEQKGIEAYKLAIFFLFNNSLEDFINYLKSKGYPVKFGLEVCNFQNQEKVQEILSKYEWDYLIVSIHFIKGWGFDFSALKHKFNDESLKNIWKAYADEITNIANTGLL